MKNQKRLFPARWIFLLYILFNICSCMGSGNRRSCRHYYRPCRDSWVYHPYRCLSNKDLFCHNYLLMGRSYYIYSRQEQNADRVERTFRSFGNIPEHYQPKQLLPLGTEYISPILFSSYFHLLSLKGLYHVLFQSSPCARGDVSTGSLPRPEDEYFKLSLFLGCFFNDFLLLLYFFHPYLLPFYFHAAAPRLLSHPHAL